MGGVSFDLSDYVDVAERREKFFEKYPEGRLQTDSWGVEEVAGKSFVWVKALAYRSPDDAAPASAVAWEPTPGKTPYTRDSELMNAETSAWGRAILAVMPGGTSKKGLASAQEVRNRVAEGQETVQAGRKVARAPKGWEKQLEALQDADGVRSWGNDAFEAGWLSDEVKTAVTNKLAEIEAAA